MCINQQPCLGIQRHVATITCPSACTRIQAQGIPPWLFLRSSRKTCSWVQGLYREHTEAIVVFFVLGGAKNSSMSPPCRPSTATDEGEAPGGPVTAWCPWLINNPYLYLRNTKGGGEWRRKSCLVMLTCSRK
jgi:hypothetical protein